MSSESNGTDAMQTFETGEYRLLAAKEVLKMLSSRLRSNGAVDDSGVARDVRVVSTLIEDSHERMRQGAEQLGPCMSTGERDLDAKANMWPFKQIDPARFYALPPDERDDIEGRVMLSIELAEAKQPRPKPDLSLVKT